jgi:predicted transposase YbfD/YdcC
LAEAAGAILITQVKKNQKSLLKQVEDSCCVQKPIDIHEDEVEKKHGRLEQRKYEVFNSLPILDKLKKKWPYIRSIIRVTRQRNSSITTSYYVSNKVMNAKEVGGYIRDHWYIENKLHHIKDRDYMEDRTPKRVNPHIFSYCMDISINALRSKGVTNMREALYNNRGDLEQCIRYLQ